MPARDSAPEPLDPSTVLRPTVARLLQTVDEDHARVGPDRHNSERAAQNRDRTAADRDQTADKHDEASVDRDRRAEVRDLCAEARERTGSQSGAAADRAGALRDRRGAGTDRYRAAHDRKAAAGDRTSAAADRAVSGIDELTGAHSRSAGVVGLERDVERARRTQQPFTLVFVDVDDLKGTNDSQGHAAGDRLLRATVDAIRAHLRSYDLIVRVGGDEFLCGLVDVAIADVAIRFSLVNEYLAKTRQASVTAGLAELAGDEALKHLIARADAALYDERLRVRSPRAPGGVSSRWVVGVPRLEKSRAKLV